MRMIGHVESEPSARTISDYRYVKGIKNQVEAEGDGKWAIWILAEEEIEQARGLLRTYLANPNDSSVKHTAAQAEELRDREEQDQTATQKRRFDRDRLFPAGGWASRGRVTLALIAISVLVFVAREYTSVSQWTQYLFITDAPFSTSRDLPEVREGQVWRLLTPIFLHFSILHILFNMLWLQDLGAMVENRKGTVYLLLLVAVIGVASNVAQFYVTGRSEFGGMSGVVYGLLGYVWMKGKYDPASGMFLHPSTVAMMLIWLALGFTNYLPVQMANTVHTVGLAVGVIWGVATARA
jgi:GlpG protein